ncbi:MAG: response regulator transcription factor [Lentisphaerae bacterium]|nr:response regulator transcription factor [Lentisphaerota bacterium]
MDAVETVRDGERDVFVVDDDDAVRSGMAKLLLAEGYTVRTFDSAEAFLERGVNGEIACIVLDLQMPGLTGLELQEHLIASGHELPIVFVTAHGDIPDSVRAMKRGAIDFLSKPFDSGDFLDAVRQAIDTGKVMEAERVAAESVKQHVAALTPREYEVMRHVIAGLLNKQIAYALDISEKTIKIHRARVMTKMCVDSVAALVRDTARVGITPVDAEL